MIVAGNWKMFTGPDPSALAERLAEQIVEEGAQDELGRIAFDRVVDARTGRGGRVGRSDERLPDQGGVEPDGSPRRNRRGVADAGFGDDQPGRFDRALGTERT
jgi:hypothetical protein